MLLTQLVSLACEMYLIGLIAYAVTHWLRGPQVPRVRAWLARWYEWPLTELRKKVKPMTIGSASVDVSFIALALLVLVARYVILLLLMGPAAPRR